MVKDKTLIPKGMYCYFDGHEKPLFEPCPYYERIKTVKLYENEAKMCDFRLSCLTRKAGYCGDEDYKVGMCRAEVVRCNYLDYTDYNEESLLWDMCKECGENNKWD